MERDILSPKRRVDILLWMGVGEGIFGASHGYYRRPGDGNMPVSVCVCVCDVKERKNWRRCYEDSTAGSCHSFDPPPAPFHPAPPGPPTK